MSTKQPPKKRTKRADEKLQSKYVKSIVEGDRRPVSATATRKEQARKPTEPKTPSALSVDARAAAALLQVEGEAAPLQPVPRRENQTTAALGVRLNRGLHSVVAQEDDDEAMEVELPAGDLQRELFRVNAFMHARRPQPVAPLEELAQLGLLSSQVESLDQRQDAMAAQCNRHLVDRAFVASQLSQLHREGDQAPLHRSGGDGTTVAAEEPRRRKKTAKTEEGGAEPGMAKLSLVYGPLTFTLQYRKHHEWEADFARRQERFFRDDALEPQTGHCVAAHRFAMFRELTRQNMARYQARDAPLRQAAPKRALETVCREEMTAARRRPVAGEPLCARGQRCCFYQFSTDPQVRYVGRVFRPEHEAQQREPLCVDCVLQQWTLRHARNVMQKLETREPFNWFTVQVGPGQYSQRCMLGAVFDDRPTGIVGCVPCYDPKQRELCVVQERRLERHAVVLVTDSYVGETGTDF